MTHETIHINKDLQNQFVGYILTDKDGQAVKADIEIYNQLLNTSISENCELHIIMKDSDRLILFNNFKQYCATLGFGHIFKTDIKQFIKEDKRVLCVDTGEIFKSPTEAATVHKISYDALIKLLKNTPCYKSVKGKVYKYVVAREVS